MNIGIIGSGNVGTGIAKRLVPRGHTVMLSFNRAPEKLKELTAALGVKTGTITETVRFGEVIVLATPWVATAAALQEVADPPSGKILWDCTNTLKPDLSGLVIGTTISGGEEVANLAPWAKVVKAIPPFAEMLHSSSMTIDGKRSTVFVCGDDRDACTTVSKLVDQIGAQPVDAGPLAMARYTEPACMLLIQLAYKQGLGARIGLSLIQEASADAGR
jgi:predicted dinucleotide-binding enzyme